MTRQSQALVSFCVVFGFLLLFVVTLGLGHAFGWYLHNYGQFFLVLSSVSAIAWTAYVAVRDLGEPVQEDAISQEEREAYVGWRRTMALRALRGKQ